MQASCGHGCGADCSAPNANKGCYGRCTDGRCAVGWMILDKDDPLKVVARAEETLLFAELPFETTGTNATGKLQTPWVVRHTCVTSTFGEGRTNDNISQ